MKTNLSSTQNEIDVNAIKILFSVLAILGASIMSSASAVTTPSKIERSLDSIVTNDLKSCPAPVSAEYCKGNIPELNTCQNS